MRRMLCYHVFVSWITLSLASCQSVPSASFIMDRADQDQLADRYAETPGDTSVALAYADALQARGQVSQATAVLEQAAIHNPDDKRVLAAYGMSLVRSGRNRQARDVLVQAHTPDRPDPSVLGAEAVAADQMGDHATAQDLYRAALQISPHNSVLHSNYGMSLILTKSLDEAETQLRLAVTQLDADRTARLNFALVLALQGKSREAQDYAALDLDENEARLFVASVARKKNAVN